MNDSNDNSDSRPSAESFLEEASREGRGKLKIFLGASPGVGKTYAMLQAAHERKAEGIDVVAAIVETHGRAETHKLFSGLEVIPKKKVTYRNREFEEMDLEKILERRPQLVLVDELAHTNVPGSIHEKRYQDVEIMLENQIDVYTTVNIQHLESLNDVISQIAKVKVRETLPDHIFKSADEVELVDLPPKELIRRLSEGKVYVKDQARNAIRHFFSPSNLTALRELALRHTAEQVDDQMLQLMQKNAIKGPWPTRDRIMVCIDHHPNSENLIRAASRISARRRAPLITIYVESPSHYLLSEKAKEQVYKNFQLAENLGSETITLSGRDIAATILAFARNRNVTQLVVGRKKRPQWLELITGSVVHKLIRKSANIDVYVINFETLPTLALPPERQYAKVNLNIFDYIKSSAAVLLITLAAITLHQFVALDLANLLSIFLIPVIFSAVNYGSLPAVYSSFLSMFLYDFFFVEPLHTPTFPIPLHSLTLIAFIATGITASTLSFRAKSQAVASERKEERTAALYQLSREMASAVQLDDVLAAIVVKLDNILNAETIILLPDESKKKLKVVCPPEFEYDEKEQAASLWSYEHEEMAGRGTETLTTARRLYVPLKTQRGIVGILGVEGKKGALLKDLEFRQLLDALSAQSALAIERARLAEEMEEAIITRERESLRSILLSSISQDLKTPLAAVIGSVSALKAAGKKLATAAKDGLIDIILDESEKLNQFIANLLEMTKLETGSVIPRIELVDIYELVNYSVNKEKKMLAGHTVKRDREME